MNSAVRAALLVAALCAAALAALAGSPAPPLSADEISAVQLAEWIRSRRPGLLVLDTRSAEAMQRDGLPGARLAAQVHERAATTVVVYGDIEPEQTPAMRWKPARVLKLRGGVEAWNSEVLFPVIRSDASDSAKRRFAARARLSRYFGGSPRVLDPGARSSGRPRSRRGC